MIPSHLAGEFIFLCAVAQAFFLMHGRACPCVSEPGVKQTVWILPCCSSPHPAMCQAVRIALLAARWTMWPGLPGLQMPDGLNAVLRYECPAICMQSCSWLPSRRQLQHPVSSHLQSHLVVIARHYMGISAFAIAPFSLCPPFVRSPLVCVSWQGWPEPKPVWSSAVFVFSHDSHYTKVAQHISSRR